MAGRAEAGHRHPPLARRVVLDERFDPSLYRRLQRIAGAESREILEQLVPIEVRHYHFWQAFFDLPIERTNLVIMAAAMAVTFAIGTAARLVLGVSV